MQSQDGDSGGPVCKRLLCTVDTFLAGNLATLYPACEKTPSCAGTVDDEIVAHPTIGNT